MEKEKTVFEIVAKDETGDTKKVDLNLVLENGDVLLNEIQKAQQLVAELNIVFANIQNFKPQYRLK